MHIGAQAGSAALLIKLLGAAAKQGQQGELSCKHMQWVKQPGFFVSVPFFEPAVEPWSSKAARYLVLVSLAAFRKAPRRQASLNF